MVHDILYWIKPRTSLDLYWEGNHFFCSPAELKTEYKIRKQSWDMVKRKRERLNFDFIIWVTESSLQPTTLGLFNHMRQSISLPLPLSWIYITTKWDPNDKHVWLHSPIQDSIFFFPPHLYSKSSSNAPNWKFNKISKLSLSPTTPNPSWIL